MRTGTKSLRSIAAPALAALVVSAALGAAHAVASAAAPAAGPFAWPAALAPFGDGYPHAGDACRRLGESAATSAYLDHTATLIGCPGDAASPSARAIVREHRATVVGEHRGVTLLSVPHQRTMLKASPAHKTKRGCE